MKERGILFQAPLVRALLAGTKTQTRRLIKPQPTRQLPNEKALPSPSGEEWTIRRELGWRWQQTKKRHLFVADGHDFAGNLAHHCPYGVPGDRLWVRETWSKSAIGVYPCPPCWYRADFGTFDDPANAYDMHDPGCGGNSADCFACVAQRESKFKWRPSIFMPRSASRVTLEVTEVRAQRLQDITEDDACAEGVAPIGDVGCPCEGPQDLPGPHLPACPWIHQDVDPDNEPHRAAFAVLWDRINGDASWTANPWVWSVSFERVKEK